MKFRFCGDLDAPDWILREISVLSKITSVRIKLITVSVINSLFGTSSVDYEKVAKLTTDAGLDGSDVKGSLAALVWIVSSAARYDVEDTTLSNELQQLGLPKEHCDTISRTYRENSEKLRQKFAEQVFKLPRLAAVDWRVDYILTSSSSKDVNAPFVSINLGVKGPDNKTTNSAFSLSSEKFRVLLHELSQARSIMEQI